jgi:hypothetical protein
MRRYNIARAYTDLAPCLTNVLAKFCGKLRELSAQIAVKFFNLLPKQILTEADHSPGFFFISTTLRRHFQEMNREGRPTKGIVQQGGSPLRKRKKVCHRRPQALGDPVGLVQNLGGRQDGTLNPS